jgi:hypothetical protein
MIEWQATIHRPRIEIGAHDQAVDLAALSELQPRPSDS